MKNIFNKIRPEMVLILFAILFIVAWNVNRKPVYEIKKEKIEYTFEEAQVIFEEPVRADKKYFHTQTFTLKKTRRFIPFWMKTETIAVNPKQYFSKSK